MCFSNLGPAGCLQIDPVLEGTVISCATKALSLYSFGENDKHFAEDRQKQLDERQQLALESARVHFAGESFNETRRKICLPNRHNKIGTGALPFLVL